MQISTHIRIVFGVVLAAVALVPAGQAASLSQNESELLGAMNEVRATHDLRPLRVDGALVRAARAYSTTLMRTDVFTHGSLGPRLARAGARGPLFGENLAWGVGSRATARGIVRSWLASPGHRANLLRPGWTRIGLGARTGTFMGYSGATVVTANFAGS
ncbi:MAG: CAP domain-containing protein [Actinomycetota bacterium]|nr:CAP domain-containing protein [Actinomycetota bacterium]